jgi:hypothetical protein
VDVCGDHELLKHAGSLDVNALSVQLKGLHIAGQVYFVVDGLRLIKS